MIKPQYIFFSLIILIFSCKKIDDLTPETRSFHIGFQPWAHDLGYSATVHAYDNISIYGDIISTQLDDGIPWEQAYTGADFPTDVLDNINERKALTPQNAKVFLSLMPLSEGRDDIAQYWGQENETIKQQWSSKKFTDTAVVTAYLNYCRRMIDFFQPDYFCYAVEANASFSETDITYQEFLPFCDTIYSIIKIKARYIK